MHAEALSGGVAAFDEAVRERVCPHLNELGQVALGEMRAVIEQVETGDFAAISALAGRLAQAIEEKAARKGAETPTAPSSETTQSKTQEAKEGTGPVKEAELPAEPIAETEPEIAPLAHPEAAHSETVLPLPIVKREDREAAPANGAAKAADIPPQEVVQICRLDAAADQIVAVDRIALGLHREQSPAIAVAADAVQVEKSVSLPEMVQVVLDEPEAVDQEQHAFTLELPEPQPVEYDAVPAALLTVVEQFDSLGPAQLSEQLLPVVEEAIGVPTEEVLGELLVLDACREVTLSEARPDNSAPELVYMSVSKEPVPPVLADYIEDVATSLEEIQLHMDDAPLEQTLAELVTCLEENWEDPDTEQIRSWLHEVRVVLQPYYETRDEEQPHLTAETLNVLLAFMLAAGFTRPQDALTAFVTRHGVDQLLDAFYYVGSLDREAAQHERVVAQSGAIVYAAVDGNASLQYAFGQLLCYLTFARFGPSEPLPAAA